MTGTTKRKASAAKSKASAAKGESTIVAYKGFDKDLSCRGFKYEVGQTYTHDGDVVACQSGFHACLNPFDVWTYYGPVGEDGSVNRFARVELAGKADKDASDSKIAAAQITITAELALPAFIKEAVAWIISHTTPEIGAKSSESVIADARGYARIGSSGNGAQIGSSGDDAQIGSSGDYARIGSSGNDARIGSSGYGAKIGSSGYDAKIGSSGNGAQIGSSGDGAQIGSSGDYAWIVAEGADSVIASAGRNTRVSGAPGTYIAMAEFDEAGKCIGFATGCIGKDGLKPGVFYRASGGKLVESEQ